MTARDLLLLTIVAASMPTLTGCEEDGSRRLVQMAERHLESQAEQNRRVVELQREVAEGTRQLVEADASAREEMIALQRDVQAERVAVGQQRDALEEDRRELAAQRRLDPIIAAAITHVGLLLVCLLPLVLCWYLLHQPPDDGVEAAVNEVLLEDLVADRPLLLPPAASRRAIEHGSGTEASADVDNPDAEHVNP